jgi:hypothetical protein
MPYTVVDKGSKYFNTVTYTGTGANQTITVGFQPDWVWTKSRSLAYSNEIQDAVRGTTKVNYSDNTNAEDTTSTNIQSFNSTGYVQGSGTGVNGNGATFVSWNWLGANTTVSNTSGTITSTVSANTTSGFSIVSYTGTGTAGATVGHGLGTTPSMFIIKNRIDSSASFWCVYHKSAFVSQSNPNILYLNSSGAESDDINVLGNSTVTINSTVFSLGDYNGSNGSGDAMIAYCFAEVKGYSKFGSYTGNGSTDGTFVYTGFKPAFVLTKASSTTGQWIIHDTARDPFNQANRLLYPSLSNAEENNISDQIDILSNGFKIRATGSAINGSGSTYIYMAFAENPFVSSKGIPTTAR